MNHFCFLLAHRSTAKYRVKILELNEVEDGQVEIVFTLDGEGPYVRVFTDHQEVLDRSALIQLSEEGLRQVLAWWRRLDLDQSDPALIRGKEFEIESTLTEVA